MIVLSHENQTELRSKIEDEFKNKIFICTSQEPQDLKEAKRLTKEMNSWIKKGRPIVLNKK